jgi:hypothetical protein
MGAVVAGLTSGDCSGLVGGGYFMCLASLGMLALAFGHSFCAGLTVPPDEPVV